MNLKLVLYPYGRQRGVILATQKVLETFKEELGIGVVAFNEMVYLSEEDRYEEVSKVSSKDAISSISGTQVREEYLNKGIVLPNWFTRPEVALILSESYPPRHRQGMCIWFTSSTRLDHSIIFRELKSLLMERGRILTILKDDVMLAHLSTCRESGKMEYDNGILTIGFMASEIIRHGGITLRAAIGTSRPSINKVREMIGSDKFVDVLVDASPHTCEQVGAREVYTTTSKIGSKDLPRTHESHETNSNMTILLNTTVCPPQENARIILNCLEEQGYIL